MDNMKLSFPTSYCVFDFETTDLDVTKAEVVEIGAKKVIRDIYGKITTEETRTWLININRDLPEITTKITGITTEEMRKGGIPVDQAFNDFTGFCAGLPFVGHNICRYDIPILLNTLARLGRTSSPIQYYCTQCVDTAALYKGQALKEPHRHNETHLEYVKRILEIRSPTKFNLLYACTQLGITSGDVAAHRAGGDVELAGRLYRKITEII